MISQNFDKLFQAAKDVRKNAHVPYSKFKVGASFLTEDNSVIVGCNVENAAYPQSQCAEATAIGNLVANGFAKIKEVVVLVQVIYYVLHVEDVVKDSENFHHSMLKFICVT